MSGQVAIVLNSNQISGGVGLAMWVNSLSQFSALNIRGHNLGGDAAITMAWALDALGISVHGLFTIDSVCGGPCASIPGNVDYNINAYQPNGLLHGGPNKLDSGNTYTRIYDLDFPGYNHYSILDQNKSIVPDMIIKFIAGGGV